MSHITQVFENTEHNTKPQKEIVQHLLPSGRNSNHARNFKAKDTMQITT